MEGPGRRRWIELKVLKLLVRSCWMVMYLKMVTSMRGAGA
jgi:hypothetical protein